jgi:EAL domain-containing protein (putative c-di-GMP-specific phosphodiesterase class I)
MAGKPASIPSLSEAGHGSDRLLPDPVSPASEARRALERHYQPIVSLQTRRIYGYEALEWKMAKDGRMESLRPS